MITKKDAIAIGKHVIKALQDEEALIANNKTDPVARYAARGVALRALQNIWYSLPVKAAQQIVKETGLNGYDAYFKIVGWE